MGEENYKDHSKERHWPSFSPRPFLATEREKRRKVKSKKKKSNLISLVELAYKAN
jgi:hypothetical protein